VGDATASNTYLPHILILLKRGKHCTLINVTVLCINIVIQQDVRKSLSYIWWT